MVEIGCGANVLRRLLRMHAHVALWQSCHGNWPSALTGARTTFAVVHTGAGKQLQSERPAVKAGIMSCNADSYPTLALLLIMCGQTRRSARLR